MSIRTRCQSKTFPTGSRSTSAQGTIHKCSFRTTLPFSTIWQSSTRRAPIRTHRQTKINCRPISGTSSRTFRPCTLPWNKAGQTCLPFSFSRVLQWTPCYRAKTAWKRPCKLPSERRGRTWPSFSCWKMLIWWLGFVFGREHFWKWLNLHKYVRNKQIWLKLEMEFGLLWLHCHRQSYFFLFAKTLFA